MGNFKSIVFILLFALFACTDKQNSLDKTTSESQENKYNDNETYDYGGIILLTKTNLPLTGFRLVFDKKDGFIESEEYYINGRLNGLQKHYRKDGSMSYYSHYNDGKITEDRMFYKDGSQSSLSYYNDGETRYIKKWYENGRQKEERNYENGELNGKFLRWYENGYIKEISNFEKGLRIGWQREYLENGKLIYEVNLINGNGKISYMYANKNIRIEKKYVFGKEVNPQIGKKYKILNLRQGKMTKIVEEFFQNGELNSRSRGFNDTVSSEYKYKNGIMDEHNYKNGIAHGVTKFWNSNGAPSYEQVFFYEQLDGQAKYWYDNGQLKELSKYDKGIFISKKCWDENGKLIDCKLLE